MSHSIFPPNLAATHSLPNFRSLIIQGPYPPSAPLHLCLSHLTPGPPSLKALLLSSSSTYLSNKLEEYNDAWLIEHAGSGAIAEHLHQIDIYYPPTHQHLRLLLARLRTFSTSGIDADSETDMKTCITRAPTLVVLHELSRYFISPVLPEGSEAPEPELPTLSTYMQLVMDAIASLKFLHTSTKPLTPPRLVLFDTALGSLVLPIFRSVSTADIGKLPALHKARAVDALQRYIGWVGTIEKVEEVASSQADEVEFGFHSNEDELSQHDKDHFRMTLRQSPYATTCSDAASKRNLEWYSYRDMNEHPFTPRRRTIITAVSKRAF
ncbi:hypothetical protein BDV93DRAFT_554766 [Ceratobasidium sp. AG-I]|nr:hypothetical protein BDV93DRAFT_554766 [Ceratobasidium sp. AG-I]